MPSLVKMFAYGSNMCLPRIRERVGSATFLETAYITHRRLAFHKRGNDGSAKADAHYTGNVSDCVWGVVFSLNVADKPFLDEFERGYDEEEVVALGNSMTVTATTYVARADSIDTSLKPFSWYQHFLIHGAREHQLPVDYIRYLESFESITDPDGHRYRHNSQLIERPCR